MEAIFTESIPQIKIKKILLKLVGSRVLILFLMPFALYIALSHFIPLIEPDESRYFEISDNMVDSGDYVMPRLAGVIYLEKPPLSYWASALVFKLFGETDFTTRLYVGICAWACLLLVYFMGSFLHDRSTGLYAAGMLGTSLFFFIFGNFNILDIPLTFYTCLATLGGIPSCYRHHRQKSMALSPLSGQCIGFFNQGIDRRGFPICYSHAMVGSQRSVETNRIALLTGGNRVVSSNRLPLAYSHAAGT